MATPPGLSLSSEGAFLLNRIQELNNKLSELEKSSKLILLENKVTTTYINRAEGIVKAYQDAYEGHRKKHLKLKQQISELKLNVDSNRGQINANLEGIMELKKDFVDHRQTQIVNFTTWIDKTIRYREVLRELIIFLQIDKEVKHEIGDKLLLRDILEKLGGGQSVDRNIREGVQKVSIPADVRHLRAVANQSDTEPKPPEPIAFKIEKEPIEYIKRSKEPTDISEWQNRNKDLVVVSKADLEWLFKQTSRYYYKDSYGSLNKKKNREMKEKYLGKEG